MFIKFTYTQLIWNSVHLGYDKLFSLTKSSWFFKGLRQNIYIIDIFYTFLLLRTVCTVCINIISKRGVILFVNNFKIMSSLVEYWAKKSGQPFSNIKWFTGGLTNVKELLCLLEYIKINRLKLKAYVFYIYGLITMRRLPNAVFLSSLSQSLHVKKESIILKIPAFALVDTNQDTFGLGIGIPANDQSISSLLFFHKILNKSIIFGKYNCILQLKSVIKRKSWKYLLLYKGSYRSWWQERFFSIYIENLKRPLLYGKRIRRWFFYFKYNKKGELTTNLKGYGMLFKFRFKKNVSRFVNLERLLNFNKFLPMFVKYLNHIRYVRKSLNFSTVYGIYQMYCLYYLNFEKKKVLNIHYLKKNRKIYLYKM